MRRPTLVLVVILSGLIALQSRIAVAASKGTDVFEAVGSAITTIRAPTATGSPRNGSGVLIGADRVLTNCHVIDESSSIEVTFSNGKTVSAGLLGRYGKLDLCLLRAPSEARRPVRTVSAAAVKPGQQVFAIGAPLGLQMTISEGIVSAIREHDGYSLVQTTAPISPGSSGGGLFDEKANLIAITTSTYSTGQNINFAIPADYAFSQLLQPIATIAPSAADASFKGLPFGTGLEVFQRNFPGSACDALNATTTTCEGRTDFFGREAEFTAFFGSKGMHMAYVRIYADDMDDAFTSASLSLADRFKWFTELRPGSSILWDVGGKKEQGVFLVKCDGNARCLRPESPGIMVYISDFRLQPPKRKDF